MSLRSALHRPLAIVAAAAALAAGGLVAVAAPAQAAMPSSPTVTFSTPGGPYAYTVPDGVTKLRVQALGGSGGTARDGSYVSGYGGAGGLVTGDVAVTPGQVLQVSVAGNGQDYDASGSGYYPAGGTNGGGAGYIGAGGGGASDVRTDAGDLSSRLVVAAGGGGAYQNGGAAEQPGTAPYCSEYCVGASAAQPGTQTAGGAGGVYSDRDFGTDRGGDGGFGTGGTYVSGSGAGGGAGWYGGGGGAGIGGGAGGSNHVAASVTNVRTSLGSTGAAPYVAITVPTPVTGIGVRASSSQIVADGSSTTVVTATITTAAGVPVERLPVSFSSSLGNVFSEVLMNPDGSYSAAMRSTTTLGDAVVTATVQDDDGTSYSATTTVRQVVGPAVAPTLTAAPTTIVADGASTSTVTAHVADASGHPLDGHTLAFTASDPAAVVSSTTAVGGGDYRATIRSSTTLGTVTVTATDTTPTTPLSGTTTVQQVAGPAARLALTAASGTLVADGTSTDRLTASVADAQGHPLTGESVQFGSTDQGQRFSAVTDNGDGTYSVTLTSSTTLGRSDVTATVRSAPSLSSSTPIRQVVGAAQQVLVQATDTRLLADGTSTTTVRARVSDSAGHPLTGEAVGFTVDDPDVQLTNTQDLGDGSYEVTYTASSTVRTVTVTATDLTPSTPVSGSTTIDQVAGPAARLTLSAPEDTLVADGTSSERLTATVADAQGHPLSGQSLQFTSTDDQQVFSRVDDRGDGSYQVLLTASTRLGAAEVTVSLPAVPSLTRSATITQVPGAAAAVDVAADESVLVADGATSTTVTASVTDEVGHPLAGEAVGFTVDDPDARITNAVDRGDGRYQVTYTTSRTLHDVTVTATDITPTSPVSGSTTIAQVAGPARSLEVTSDARTITADGTSTAHLTATVTDAVGHPLSNEEVRFASTDDGQSFSEVTDRGDGTYTTTLRSSTRLGSSTVTVTDETEGARAVGSVTIEQAVGDAARVTLASSTPAVVADGTSTFQLTVGVRDGSDHPLAGQRVRVTSSDPDQRLGEPVDRGDGTYVVDVTASTTVGATTITATVPDVSTSPSGSVTVDQVLGDVSTTTVTLSPATVVADGTSTTEATVRVEDVAGHPLSGQTVTLTTGDGRQLVGPVTDRGDGTYVATIRSSTTAGTVAVTATAGGVSGSAELVQTAGAPAEVSLDLGPAVVGADGTVTRSITLTVVDAFGNRVAGASPRVRAADPAVRISTIVDNGDGTYSAVLTEPAGTDATTLSVTVGPVTGAVSVPAAPTRPTEPGGTLPTPGGPGNGPAAPVGTVDPDPVAESAAIGRLAFTGSADTAGLVGLAALAVLLGAITRAATRRRTRRR